MRLVCLLFLLAALTVNAAGCLAVAVGAGAAGTVAYLAGDLDTEEPYPIDQTYAAARKAANELGLKIIEGETGKDALSACVIARDAGDKRVAIRLKAITSNATKLSIRVGTFGDDTKAHLIYNTIRENLRAVAEEPARSPEPTAASSQSATG